MPITSINPATGATINTYREMTAERRRRRGAGSPGAWRSWRKTSFAERQLTDEDSAA